MTPGSIVDEWGAAETAGFHLHENPRPYAPGFPFTVSWINGRQVAVFIDVEVPVEARANLESLKPDWLDAVVYARVISDPSAELAVIEAHTTNAEDAGLHMCAFATACAASDLGLFKVERASYLVRFETRAPVCVIMGFDWDAESWFGEATVDFDDTR